MNDHNELFAIGPLADRTGLPVRTIRFWSDAGLIPPTRRSAGGYRLYDAAAVARTELVRTLRELGLDLDTVRRILDRRTTVADVARTHVEALDAEIRTLRLRRAVLWSVAQRGSTTEEMRIMHELARLSAQERQQIIDDFVNRAFDGVPDDAKGADIAHAMRRMPVDLPDDPAPEQVEAWVELAGLAADPAFLDRVREMAVAGARWAAERGDASWHYDPSAVLEHAGGAVAAGVLPASADGRTVLDRIVDPDTPAAERVRITETLETFTDRRVERYWQLIGIINGRPPFAANAPAFEWLIAALRAHA